MSLQDESFPHDEFFNELEFSLSKSQHFQFPYLRRQPKQQQSLQMTVSMPAVSVDRGGPAAAKPNASASSNEENVSTESTNGGPSSVLSAKTSASDPTGFEDEAKTSHYNSGEFNKAISCQNVHSEYTRRRYKHVQSKVGQYIAQMKAEDEKRRTNSKFKRHSSLPETLINGDAVQLLLLRQRSADAGDGGEGGNGATTKKTNRFSGVAEMHMYQSNKADGFISDPEADLSEIMTATPATTTSGSSSSSSHHRHECSDEAAAPHTDFIDKRTYAQLVNEKERVQSYSDYVQYRLDEKIDETVRLKRNVEYLRIELANCQDKLKRHVTLLKQSELRTSLQSFMTVGFGGGSDGFERHSTQSLLAAVQTKVAKATQTEPLTPPPPPRQLSVPSSLGVASPLLLFTPTSSNTPPGANNNSDVTAVNYNITSTVTNCAHAKSVVSGMQPITLNFSSIGAATDLSSHDGSGGGGGSARQNVLRQRLNASQQHPLMLANGDDDNAVAARSACMSSSDSAIDIESAGLSSPAASQLQRARSGGVVVEQNDGGEFVYYNGRTGRYTALNALSAAVNTHASYTPESSSSDVGVSGGAAKKIALRNKKQNSLRRRWLRFFAPCSGACNDANHSAVLDNSGGHMLLEKSAERLSL